MKSLIIITLSWVAALWIMEVPPWSSGYFPAAFIFILGTWFIWKWKSIFRLGELLDYVRGKRETKIDQKNSALKQKTNSYRRDLNQWEKEWEALVENGVVEQDELPDVALEKLQSVDSIYRTFKKDHVTINEMVKNYPHGFFTKMKTYTALNSSYSRLQSSHKKIENLHQEFLFEAEKLSKKYRKMLEVQEEKQRLKHERERKEDELERERILYQREKEQQEAEQLKEIEIAKIRAEKEKERDLEIMREHHATDLLLKEKEHETTKMLLELERLKASKAQSDKDRFDRLKSLLDD